MMPTIPSVRKRQHRKTDCRRSGSPQSRSTTDKAHQYYKEKISCFVVRHAAEHVKQCRRNTINGTPEINAADLRTLLNRN